LKPTTSEEGLKGSSSEELLKGSEHHDVLKSLGLKDKYPEKPVIPTISDRPRDDTLNHLMPPPITPNSLDELTLANPLYNPPPGLDISKAELDALCGPTSLSVPPCSTGTPPIASISHPPAITENLSLLYKDNPLYKDPYKDPNQIAREKEVQYLAQQAKYARFLADRAAEEAKYLTAQANMGYGSSYMNPSAPSWEPQGGYYDPSMGIEDPLHIGGAVIPDQLGRFFFRLSPLNSVVPPKLLLISPYR